MPDIPESQYILIRILLKFLAYQLDVDRTLFQGVNVSIAAGDRVALGD